MQIYKFVKITHPALSTMALLSLPLRTRDEYHLLSREQQSVLVRLLTGHNRLYCLGGAILIEKKMLKPDSRAGYETKKMIVFVSHIFIVFYSKRVDHYKRTLLLLLLGVRAYTVSPVLEMKRVVFSRSW